LEAVVERSSAEVAKARPRINAQEGTVLLAFLKDM
jgi:hypothetical protein